MANARLHNRRKANAKPYRLEQPLFAHVPRDIASSVAAVCALGALGANLLYFQYMAFGPIFLMICVLSSWFVGARFAVILLLYIVGFEYLTGHILYRHDAGILNYVETLIRGSVAVAIILMLGVAREALEIEWRYARIDPLTGALTRKAFFEAIGGGGNNHEPTVLVFADVNGLKQINDQLGHDVGDKALESFATRVASVIRKKDLFARIGGDEFVIACKVRDNSAAQIIAQRLNNAVNVEQAEGPAKLSCSFGVLALPNGLTAIDEELKKADKLMYFAKKRQAGAVVGISVNGELHKLRPIASNGHGDEKYPAAFRSYDRTKEAGDEISKITEAA